MKVKEAEPGEFYIFNLAIRPDFQKAGLGPRLLQNAEEKARRAGLSKASLGVTMDNQGALRFYFRHGYRSVETIPAPKKLQERIGYDGFYRLVKELEIPS